MWVVGSWTWWQCHFLQTHQVKTDPPCQQVHSHTGDTAPRDKWSTPTHRHLCSGHTFFSPDKQEAKLNFFRTLIWSKRPAARSRVMWSIFTCCAAFVRETHLSLPFLHTTLFKIKWTKKRRKAILWRSRCEYSSLWLRTEETPGLETSSRSPVDSFEAEEYLKLRWTYKKQFNEAQKGRWCRRALWATAGIWVRNSLHCCPLSVATPLFVIAPTMLPRPSLVITLLVCYHAHHMLPSTNLRLSVNLKNRMGWDIRCKM